MSLRLPSVAQPYDDFYSRDPAIKKPTSDATKDQLAEHEHTLEVARETGDWTPIVEPGQEPTKFTMKPLPGNVYRELIDAISTRTIGPAKMAQIAFRAAIKSISNLGDVKVKTEDTERYGTLATIELTNKLDAISLGIVGELGGEALRRARDLSPK